MQSLSSPGVTQPLGPKIDVPHRRAAVAAGPAGSPGAGSHRRTQQKGLRSEPNINYCEHIERCIHAYHLSGPLLLEGQELREEEGKALAGH